MGGGTGWWLMVTYLLIGWRHYDVIGWRHKTTSGPVPPQRLYLCDRCCCCCGCRSATVAVVVRYKQFDVGRPRLDEHGTVFASSTLSTSSARLQQRVIRLLSHDSDSPNWRWACWVPKVRQFALLWFRLTQIKLPVLSPIFPVLRWPQKYPALTKRVRTKIYTEPNRK